MHFEINQPRPNDFIKIRAIQLSFQDIQSVVENFYEKVAKDHLLKVPFESVKDWPHHTENLTHFWWTRFGGQSYRETTYDPIGKHYKAGFNTQFLERWLDLFREVLYQTLTENQAQLWEAIATQMGSALSRNNEFIKQRLQG
ncbi:MAG: group III truncated hemoglobin [Bacteriovoracaceae bacterium]